MGYRKNIVAGVENLWIELMTLLCSTIAVIAFDQTPFSSSRMSPTSYESCHDKVEHSLTHLYEKSAAVGLRGLSESKKTSDKLLTEAGLI